MSLLTILSAIALFPAAIVAYKVVTHRHLTLFDVLAGAYSVNLSLFPLLASQETLDYLNIDPQSDTVIKLYAVYFSFLAVIYAAGYAINRLWPGSIICFTRYIENLPARKPIGWAELAAVAGILAICWAVMLPRAHVLVGATEVSEDYGSFSFYVTAVKMFNLTSCYLFISAGLAQDARSRKYFMILALAFVASAFMIGEGRRYFVGMALMFGCAYYARNRFARIRWGRVSAYGVAVLGLLYGAVLFFNVMRYTKDQKEFADEGTLKRLVSITEEATHNYSSFADMAAEANKTRSLGLFDILYYYLDTYHQPYGGRMFAEAFSFSVPRVIYPQKSYVGSQGLIEMETGLFSDVADSSLLWGIGDWGGLGGVMAAIFHIALFIYLAGLMAFARRWGKVSLWIVALCASVAFIAAFQTEGTIESDMANAIQFTAFFLAGLAVSQIYYSTLARYRV